MPHKAHKACLSIRHAFPGLLSMRHAFSGGGRAQASSFSPQQWQQQQTAVLSYLTASGVSASANAYKYCPALSLNTLGHVALDNPYLSSTIEMNVIDSKPWGLGVKVQQDPVGSFVQGPTNSQEASKAEFGPASSNSTPSTFSSSCVASSDASSSMESNTADKVTQCEPSSTSSSHSPTASHSGQTPPQPSLSTSHPPTGFPVSSTAYPSGHSAPQPPLLGYMSAYTQQPDGGMVPAPGSGSWTLAALEERHPLAWAHMANHPGPGVHACLCQARTLPEFVVPLVKDGGLEKRYG
eukprot:scaffold847_cov19-Tisochrysis_lutea.AAC.1